MHENLKYSINLDCGIVALENEELFEAKGKLENHKKRQVSDWQPIFSDTNYGTQFLVYAKFVGKKLSDNKSFKINLIQFYIQNYVGGVSIGFNGYFDLRTPPIDTKDPDMMDPKYPSRSKYTIEIGLQGLHTNYFKKDFKPLDFVVKEGDVLQCQSVFTPVDSSTSFIFDKDRISKSKFVDEQFMERNGDEIFITSDGEKKLRALENKYKLVDACKLLSIGIDINVPQNYKKPKEKKGRKFPCEPKSSIFMIT